MLKSIATTRSEYTAKQEKKSSYYTDYFPDLIDFFGDDWKEIKTQTEKEIFAIAKNIVLKIGLLLVISENFLRTIRENNILAIYISY